MRNRAMAVIEEDVAQYRGRIKKTLAERDTLTGMIEHVGASSTRSAIEFTGNKSSQNFKRSIPSRHTGRRDRIASSTDAADRDTQGADLFTEG